MIELLIGNIASGKSTYAKLRVQEGWFCVSDDAIINMLLADQYHMYKREYEQLITKLMHVVTRRLVSAEKNIVIDSAWNIALVQRLEYKVLFPETKVLETEFPREAPEVHARRRVEHDPRGGTYETWLEVAQRMDFLYKN